MKFSKYSALISAAIAFLFLLIYYIDIFNWSGCTMSGGHSSNTYLYINGTNDLGCYMHNAIGLLNGTWPTEPFFRAPLYTFFLAGCLIIYDSIAWVAFVQIFLSSVIVWLLCKTSALLFDYKSGVLGSIILMLYGGFVFITVVLHTAIMETFLAVLAFYCVSLLRKDFSWRNITLAGITAALAGLVRPNFLLIAPLAIIAVCVEYLIVQSGDIKNHAKYILIKKIILKSFICMCLFFTVLLPFVIWNNLHSDKLLFLTTNAAVTWRQSNSYDSFPCGIITPQKPLMPVSSLPFWKHQGLKTVHYLKSVEVPQNVNYYIFLYYSTFLKFLPINFGFIVALFLASLFYFYRDWQKLLPLLIYTVVYALTIIAFNVTGRYRLPAVPLMLIPVSAMLIDIYKYRLLRKKKVIITGIIFIFFFIFSEPWSIADNFNSWGNQARRSLFALNLKEYQNCVSKMYNINPNNCNVRMTLFASSAMNGDFKLAHYIIQNEAARYKNDKYLAQSILELNILEQSTKLKDRGEWLKYLKQNTKLGHLGLQYKLFLRNITKRLELGLYVDQENVTLLEEYLKF